MSVEELAQEFAVTPQVLRDVENGERLLDEHALRETFARLEQTK
jgi:ribosome-binding protein aMBF1 (putative translation factor)